MAFVEQYSESVTEPDKYWQDRVQRGATSSTVGTFVAIHNDQLIGKATGFVDDKTAEPTVHLVGVYVPPDFRGSELGVSTAVVRAVMRWARDEVGVKRVRLFVTEINGRAEAFYRRLGFARTGGTMAYPPNPEITEFEMLNTELDD